MMNECLIERHGKERQQLLRDAEENQKYLDRFRAAVGPGSEGLWLVFYMETHLMVVGTLRLKQRFKIYRNDDYPEIS